MTKNLSENQKVYLQTALMVTVLLLLVGGWFWWAKVYNAPKTIFNSMLSNSLNTYGVTKSALQKDESGTLEQLSQTQFGARNLVDIKTTISQPGEAGDTKVVTQTLGTGTENYVRYVTIDVPVLEGKTAMDFSSILNVWGKQDSKTLATNNPFSESVYGAVLFGYITSAQRQELLSMMKDKNIYKIDYGKIEGKKENGKNVIVYPVEIQTQAYIELLKRYDDMLGLKLMSQLSAEEYADAAPIKLNMSVDKVSRNLTKISYEGDVRSESYSGYGIRSNVEIPRDAISDTELQAKLEGILNGQ